MMEMTCSAPRPFAPPSVLPDISPTRGEIGFHLRLVPLFYIAEKVRTTRQGNLPPCGGDVRQDRGGQRRALISPIGSVA
jgi:hypothetical protein